MTEENTESLKGSLVGHITITGPVQCGKSIVLDHIARILEDEFEAQVASSELYSERNLGLDSTKLEDWEKKLVGDTNWVLKERDDKQDGSPCKICAENPQPKYYADPRRCAFVDDGASSNWACGTVSLLREEFEDYFRYNEQSNPVVTYHYNHECEQTSVMIDVNEVEWDENKQTDEPLVLVLSWYKNRGKTEAFYLIVNGQPPRPPTESEFHLILQHVRTNRPS